MSTFFKAFLIVALLSVFIAGCGGKIEETYVESTLREATRSEMLNPGMKFSFDTPNIIAAHKDIALVREGNLIEFFVGSDIESKVSQVGGGAFTVGARKIFNPFIYFNVDHMIAGTDTMMVDEPYEVVFPTLMSKRDFNADDFEDVDLDKITSSSLSLKNIFDKQLKVNQATVTVEEIEYKGEAKEYYILNLDNVRFIIDDPGDEMILVLKALINENTFFVGGVSFGDRTTLPSRSFRDRTKIGGEVKLHFVNFGGKVVTSIS
jgi:hypothetical protein